MTKTLAALFALALPLLAGCASAKMAQDGPCPYGQQLFNGQCVSNSAPARFR